MKSKIKKFDCVEMMHKGAENVKKKLDKMTNEQKLNYWNIRYNEINEKQTMLREKKDKYKIHRKQDAYVTLNQTTS